MACSTLTKGRVRPCKDSVGGLRNVYFVDYGTVDFTITNDIVDLVAATDVAGATLYKYEVIKGGSSFTQNIQASIENGTVVFEQVLELSLHKLSADDHKEIKLLSFGRPYIFVEDYNGNVFLAGREHGMEVTGGSIATGTAMGDMSGYTLTFTGMEVSPSQFVAQAVAGTPGGEADLTAALDTGVTIAPNTGF
jgi:hypothetical protein